MMIKPKVLLLALLCLVSIHVKAIDFDDDGIEKGYRGFVDLEYTLGVGDWNTNRVGLLTTHGYQVSTQFFAGAGIGVNYFYDDECWNIPVYADFRSDLINGNVSPFIDLKIGYSFVDVKGFYLNPSVGCRFVTSDDFAMNVAIGYTLQKTNIAWRYDKVNIGGINFRVGIEF